MISLCRTLTSRPRDQPIRASPAAISYMLMTRKPLPPSPYFPQRPLHNTHKHLCEVEALAVRIRSEFDRRRR